MFAWLGIDGDDLRVAFGWDLKAFQRRQLGFSRAAPRCPKRDHQHLAGELRAVYSVTCTRGAQRGLRYIAQPGCCVGCQLFGSGEAGCDDE